MVHFIFFILLAYIVGSIPTGYWFARCFFGIDITKKGSGNIGATNVARSLGARYFFIIFLCDAAKAYFFLYVLASLELNKEIYPLSLITIEYFAAVALMVGNAYSMFLSFAGGKGVATMCGILYFLFPPVWFMGFALYWSVLLMLTRRAYISSIGATLSLIITYVVTSGGALNSNLLFLCWLLCWTVWRHKPNIERELA